MNLRLILLLALVLPQMAALAQWVHRTDVGSPGQRTGHALAYDKDRGVTVFFGGEFGPGGGETYYNDTWEYDGSQWRQITINGAKPDTRSGHAMCYDSVHHDVILVGGVNEDGYPGDMWRYHSTGLGQGAWVNVGRMSSEDIALAGTCLVFDESRGVAVRMFGDGLLKPASPQVEAYYGKSRLIEYYNDLNTGPTISRRWDILALGRYATEPNARASAVYDPVKKQILHYGGAENNPAQEYFNPFLRAVDLGAPRYSTAPSFPEYGTYVDYDQNPSIRQVGYATPATQQAAMIYDPVRDRLVVFGGQNDPAHPNQSQGDATREIVRSSDPLEYPWIGPFYRTLASNPPGRAGHAMVFDTRRNVIVLYGGASGDTRYDDTWELPSVPSQGPVWVDFTYTGAGFGSFAFPYSTVAQGVRAATIARRDLSLIGPRATSETITIRDAMTLRAVGGPVTIGRR